MAPKHRKTNSSWEMDDARRDPPRTCAVSGKHMYSNEREANATAAHRMTDKESNQTSPHPASSASMNGCNLNFRPQKLSPDKSSRSKLRESGDFRSEEHTSELQS